MNILEMSPDDLIPYENNPRDNDGAVDAVAASIRAFGFKVPIIIDKDNVIVAGHTRLKAAQALGLASVPVIRADDLTEEQVKAFRLADNKTGELATWDFEKLDLELSDLRMVDMEQFGFEPFAGETEPSPVVDDEYTGKPEPRAQRGQVFVLGNHRVMCGDSTSKDDVDKLMGGGGDRSGLYGSALRSVDR